MRHKKGCLATKSVVGSSRLKGCACDVCNEHDDRKGSSLLYTQYGHPRAMHFLHSRCFSRILSNKSCLLSFLCCSCYISALAQIFPLQKSSFYDRLLLRWRRTRDELPFLWLSASSGSEGLSPLRNTCYRLFFRFGNSII